jgi:hypothetical protein
LFVELVRELQSRRIPLAVVAFPAFNQLALGCDTAEQDFIRQVSSVEGVPVLDLLDAFRQRRIEELYLLRYDPSAPLVAGTCFPEQSRYVGNKHLARFGHQTASRVIARFLQDRGLIPTRE